MSSGKGLQIFSRVALKVGILSSIFLISFHDLHHLDYRNQTGKEKKAAKNRRQKNDKMISILSNSQTELKKQQVILEGFNKYNTVAIIYNSQTELKKALSINDYYGKYKFR